MRSRMGWLSFFSCLSVAWIAASGPVFASLPDPFRPVVVHVEEVEVLYIPYRAFGLGTTTHEYDSRDSLTGAALPGGLAASFAYDNVNLARFAQVDPAGLAGGLNLYALANGSPLALIDSLGLCADSSSGYRYGSTDQALVQGGTRSSYSGPVLRAPVNAVEQQHWTDMSYGSSPVNAAQVQQAQLTEAFLQTAILSSFGPRAPVTTGNRVFWSGGSQTRAAAEAYAKTTGGQTLEMTTVGKILDAITTDKTYPYLKPLWNKASQNFAQGANGAVDVFQSSSRGVRLDSVWRNYEYPQLINQGNTISYHIIP